ncbi:MAG: hypothetical protein P1V20_06690 [Verrucomicrobiales bacterium]|nr:hypothetical protein [Verrucomicrobiales bacterium]
MINGLHCDPIIQKRFQFWYYCHSSAAPSVPAAAIMKRHLDLAVSRVEKTYSISMQRRIIVIGHSMGGILSKSLISSSGDDLWITAFRAPSAEFHLTPDQRNLMESAFRYSPRNYVKTVIFIATPHKGSKMANGLPGRIGMALARRPDEIESLADAFTTRNRHLLQPDFAAFVEAGVNSIATMRPDSPIADVLVKLPIDPEVRFYNIAGVKRVSKEIGDGVVPLKSAIIPGAVADLVIQSKHRVHQTPGAAHWIKEILQHEAGMISEQEMKAALAPVLLSPERLESLKSR